MEGPKPGEDPSLVLDSAPGGHHGKAYGNPEAWIDKDIHAPRYIPGRFGETMLFRGGEWGQEHIIVPDYPKAENDRLSVSAWVFAASPPTPDWAMIAANWGFDSAKPQAVVGQFHFSLAPPDGGLTVRVRQRNGALVEVHEPAPEGFPTNSWQHVAFVADGVMLRLYHNGKEVGSCPCKGVLPKPPITSLGIGCETDAAGATISSICPCYWRGQIDELAVFNRALKPEEIKQLAEEGGK